MVLWEITLATAYFLGLKRTYKIVLKIQQRLVSPNHPQIRQFLHGRTRAVFDMAVKVHQNVQHRDIEVGRNLGNWILRWLDRMKPSAEIRGHPDGAITSTKMIKQVSNFSRLKRPEICRAAINQKLYRYMYITSSASRWPKPFPTIAMMMRQPKLAGTMIQHRHYSTYGSEALKENYKRGSFDHIIRKDIVQWMRGN